MAGVIAGDQDRRTIRRIDHNSIGVVGNGVSQHPLWENGEDLPRSIRQAVWSRNINEIDGSSCGHCIMWVYSEFGMETYVSE
jgi:hypothetical protein